MNTEFHEGYIREPIILASNIYKNIICAEVGVSSGDHAEAMFYYLKPKELHLVDHWNNNDAALEITKKIFEGCDNVLIHREDSIVASKSFPDNYFDLVYIDADHSYEAVKLDLKYWYPKVKKGGMLCGHDANRPGVEPAINEFAKEKDLKLNISKNTRNFWVIK
jgi:predicted O-methyltransferase YrrM